MSRGKNLRSRKYKKAPNEVRRSRKETTNSITQIGDNNEYSK